MSKSPLPAGAQQLLRRPNPAVMATLRSDGTPVTTPDRVPGCGVRSPLSTPDGVPDTASDLRAGRGAASG